VAGKRGKPKKKPVGRPDDWTEKKANKLGRDLLAWFQADKSKIFVAEFIVEDRDLYPDLPAYLLRKFPKSEFADCFKKAKAIQELRLMRGAMDRSMHPTMPIFLLKVHHGYSENGIMGRDVDTAPEEVKDMGERSAQDLLKDVKKRLGKE
jgi:hypothetical protein